MTRLPLARVAPALLVLGLFMATVVTAGGEATAATSADRPYNDRGFRQLNDCLASGDRIDALYVMDVSGSLEGNDPEGRRFDALEASVQQLGVLASAGSESVEVNAAVSTFGDGFTPPAQVRDWTTLPAEGSAGALAAQFRRNAELAWQDAGTSQGTDYEAALQGAGQVMRDRGSAEDACQVVLWFTDGLFALGDTYDREATDEASRRLCAPGGTVDRLREENVSVIALALTGADVDAQLRQPQYRPRRGELAAMALGRWQGKTCGTAPISPDARAGIYLSADEPGALGALFSGVAAQASGCAPEVLRTALPARFPVDRGVRRFQLDVSRPETGGEVRVRAPGQPELTVAGGSTTYAGADVEATSSGSLLSLEVTLSDQAERGVWTIDGGVRPTSVSLYRCADLRLRIEQPDAPLLGGEESELLATVVDPTGDPADLSAYRGATPDSLPEVEASSDGAGDVEATIVDPGRGQVAVQFTAPTDRLSVEVSLSFVPVLRERPGTELPAVNGSAVVPVTPPESFPTVSPAAELDLGVAEGTEPAEGEITVLGASEAASRVCFGGSEAVDAPAAAGDVAVRTSVECQELGPGEERTVAVTAEATDSADGEGRAEIPLTLENAQGDTIREDLVVRWDLERPVNVTTRLWILVLAVSLSLLLPLLVLALVNWLLARFHGGDVRHDTVGVDITPDGGMRLREEPQVAGLSDSYLERGERRRIDDIGGSGLDLVSRPPRNPLGSPEFVAVAQGGRRVLSEGDVGGRRGTEAEVTAGLGAVWLLVLDDHELLQAGDEDDVPARLCLITREEGQSRLDELVARARVALADGAWGRLRSELVEHARAAATADATRGEEHEHVAAGADHAAVEDDPFASDERPAEVRWGSSAGRGARGGRRQAEVSDDSYEDPFA